MRIEGFQDDVAKLLEEILGYLNFSSGTPDPRFLANLNALWSALQAVGAGRRKRKRAPPPEPAWSQLHRALSAALTQLHAGCEAFRGSQQGEAVLRLVFHEALPGYRRHHRDLLFHQTEESLFQPFFIGRVCEAVLRQGGPWDQTERIVAGALRLLDDFIGHRPVAVLHTQKHQPYAHEWVRPIPLFVRAAGVAAGPYHDLVEQALEILAQTDPSLLARAWFNPEWLDELALDPRAYDFDHPVNKRPNYHFGQWDPHLIDNGGHYRRYVVQQVTLESLVARLPKAGLPYAESLFEAAAVLAGTILMGSGVSGSGPQTHDSGVSLATLLPIVAAYRDEFYEQLLGRMTGPHAVRLRKEAVSLRQPLGGARQHLNQELARRRAAQLQHTRLAQLYAWMGYTEAAGVQAEVVPVTSARMSCQIYCLLTAGHLAVDRGNLEEAEAVLPKAEDLLHRAIECGALADPWNILGFGGQFSLFPAVENSTHDQRVDELIELVSQIFGLFTRLLKEAAAKGDVVMCVRLGEAMERLAVWWDQFASVEVSDVDGFSGRQAWESALHVADVLRDWHEAGIAAGDLAFWRGHLERFTSAKSYALVVESLLEQHDLVAAMALLIQWLSQSSQIPLEEQDYSFHQLAIAWMEDLLESGGDTARPRERCVGAEQRWPLARKLLDYIEANAEHYWEVPTLELAETARGGAAPAEPGEEEAIDPLYAAAYEEVTFHDSAADGIEGEMLQGGSETTDYELAVEAERLADRLAFLITVARLWKMAASALGTCPGGDAERDAVLSGWLEQAQTNRKRLGELTAAVDRYPIPSPRSNQESLVEFDRRRALKEQLLEQIIATGVETADAARSIRAALHEQVAAPGLAPWEEPVQRVFRAVFRGDREGIRAAWPDLVTALSGQPLLYVALARGGSPQKIIASRNIQRVLRRLLAYLPRLGMLDETFRLIKTIQGMEQAHAVGPGAITEFDQMFEIGGRGIVRCLTISSEQWTGKRARAGQDAEYELIGSLERAVEALLQCWLDHSRRVRLSVLEAVADDPRWRTLRHFIETYGHNLFTQDFMTLGNLRAILHQGAEAWLASLQEDPDADDEKPRLIGDLGARLDREEAARWLTVALEAVVENYAEYVDYNSTTTQSDRGEMLYTLLDFLRLQASYNRVAWNLRPVIVAHEVLVRCGRDEAAEIWRQAVIQRTSDIADEHLRRFAKLSRQYGMRLPSIAERLEERFVRPLEIARLRALAEPAIRELRDGEPPNSFRQLQKGVAPLLKQPAGVGFELPSWLEALEDEVEEIRLGTDEDSSPLDPLLPVAEVKLTADDVNRQIRRISGEN